MKTSKFFTIGISLLVFLIPIFFLPLTVDFYGLNKNTLLYVSTALILIGWAVKTYFQEKFSVNKTIFTMPVLAFMLAFLLSTILQAPNKPMSLFNSTGIILGVGILYFAIVSNIKNKTQVVLVLAGLLISSLVLSWLTIFSFLGLTETIGPAWMQGKAWTPSGSPLITLSLMVLLIPGTLYWAFNTKEAVEKILLFLAASLQILSSILVLSLFVTKNVQFIYLPPQYGWQIAVEGFKNFKTAIFGVGAGNFAAAFGQFKPAALNNTINWNTKFLTNSNEYFNLISTVGLFGLISYLWIAFTTLKKENFKGNLIRKVIYIMLATSFLIQLIIPNNVVLWMVTFLLLGLFCVSLRQTERLDSENLITAENKYLIWGLSGFFVIVSLAVLYFGGRLWLADHRFYQSLKAANENRGIETYNLQIKAIGLNPYNESYRTTYAQTNLALANSLATKETLTDQDRTNITQLLSQAVREAKVASSLNPQLSQYWANLANIYRNLISIAAQADQWAIASYLQAIRTDPTNPLLRINFGGLYFGLRDFDRAIEQFRIAINLKPDYANAYYNLSAAYQQKEDWVQAFLNMQNAISLVPADSPDRTRVLGELEELRAKLPQIPQQATQAGQLQPEQTLSAPSPIPSPQPGFGQITLPEEAAPSIPPQPTPSPSSGASALPEASQIATPSAATGF